jgi:DNA-binding response OmpR family regulator
VSGLRIVLVEDNPADVLLVREALKARGLRFSLEQYSNGEDAARAIAGMVAAPELFLLDLNIPRVHGLELLRIIRACPTVARALVAVITSSHAPEDRTQSEQHGVDSYIIKPYGYHEFVTDVGAAVTALLKRKPRGSCRAGNRKSENAKQLKIHSRQRIRNSARTRAY